MLAVTECCHLLNTRTASCASRLSRQRIQKVVQPSHGRRLHTSQRNAEAESRRPSQSSDSASASLEASRSDIGKQGAPDRRSQRIQINDPFNGTSTYFRKIYHASTEDVPSVTPRSKRVDLKPLTKRLTSDKYLEAQARINNYVWIALGSNIGDRFTNIEAACRRIDQDPDMRICETSPLYVTKPMYVEDQDSFLNGVCAIETDLEPLELLDRLQAIENDLGRVKVIDKGPRNIDLDILLYKGREVRHERLTVPHVLMMDREFVLRPLADTSARAIKPAGSEVQINRALRKLANVPLKSTLHAAPSEDMRPLVPLTHNREYDFDFESPLQMPRVMSIINVTPDSFSDGGKLYNNANDKPTSEQSLAYTERLRETMLRHVAQGADILDIGGQSSRPGAASITSEEEIARIRPALEIAQTIPEIKEGRVAVSVDTYRAAVAEAAIGMGAHIINDVSAGLLDDEMLPTVARLGCTYIMGHMRGTPETMKDLERTYYDQSGLYLRKLDLAKEKSTSSKSSADDLDARAEPANAIEDQQKVNLADGMAQTAASSHTTPAGLSAAGPVKSIMTIVEEDLQTQLERAAAAGIRRWRIILDPGLGFAKCTEANVEIVRRLPALQKRDKIAKYPWMLGVSRKRFIGDLLGGKDAGERLMGTAAMTAMCVYKGAHFVRVHDVQEMVQVVRVASLLRDSDHSH